MDVLNIISWIKGKKQVTAVDPTLTVVPLGVKDNKRGDGYIPVSITVEDFLASVSATWGSITGDIYTQSDLISLLNAKQDSLVSGSNIKTINGDTLLGSGNLTVGVSDGDKGDITVSGGGTTWTVDELPQSRITDLVTDLSSKQATLISGTNIKTINGSSILGTGDITAGAPAWLESNASQLTIWNNGKGNEPSNTSFGDSALSANVSGTNSSAYGYRSLSSNSTGSNNTAYGANTLFNNVSGNNNTAIGTNALYNNTTGLLNVSIGQGSMVANTSGSYNIAIGTSALNQNTIGQSNIAVGIQTLEYSNSYDNIAIGFEAVRLTTTGGENIGIGSSCLNLNTTGNQNVAIGAQAALRNTTASNNTSLGYYALRDNQTGSNNTVIGSNTECTNFSGSVVIGYGATATASNQFVIGSASVNAGTVTSEVNSSTQVWNVRINGVARKILLA